MRVGSLLVAALAPLVVADWMETTWYCDADLFRVCGPTELGPYHHFHTTYGTYELASIYDGCHGTSVPGMTELCIDWNNNRAHFKFSHQTSKRCLRKNAAGTRFDDNSCPYAECWRDVWDEVTCTW